MRQHPLGELGPDVGAIGLGCMGMSWGYEESTKDDAESVRVMHEAVSGGMNLLDTADVYGGGHNESLVGNLCATRREEVVLATKGGLVVDDLPTRAVHRRGTPEHIRHAVDASLRRLCTDVIDLYYLHRIDPDVPLTETWEAMAGLVTAGKVRYLGLSEVTVAEAEAAHAMYPVCAIQSELSLWTRDPVEQGVVAWCATNGVAFVPYAPLGRGFLTGAHDAPAFEESDFRTTNPRFLPGAFDANLRIVEAARTVAARHGAGVDVTPAQVAIAWTMAQGEHVTPIPGTRRSRHLAENMAAADLRLGPDDLAELDRVTAAVGSRY